MLFLLLAVLSAVGCVVSVFDCVVSAVDCVVSVVFLTVWWDSGPTEGPQR